MKMYEEGRGAGGMDVGKKEGSKGGLGEERKGIVSDEDEDEERD